MVIDLEHHWSPEELWRRHGGKEGQLVPQRRYGKTGGDLYDGLYRIDRHFEFMDSAGIDMAVITGGFGGILEECQIFNNALAQLVRQYPKRFIGLACVPPLGGDEAYQELERAVREQVSNGVKGLILDLRNNNGGLRDTAISSADIFLDSGTIVIQQDRDGTQTVFNARRGELAPGIRIVVLQNKYSASAAEILASALRDNGRAVIVGETSYGKGTVNQSERLSNGGALFVSVAHWLTPTGAKIDHVGLLPDVEVKLSDEDIELRRDAQLFRAIDVLRGQTRAP